MCRYIAGDGVIGGSQQQMGRRDTLRLAELLNTIHIDGVCHLGRMALAF